MPTYIFTHLFYTEKFINTGIIFNLNSYFKQIIIKDGGTMAYRETVLGGQGPASFFGLRGIDSLLENIYDYGLLVFLLVFTIVFAGLQKTKVLGEGRKNLNMVVALVMGMAVVIPHITGDYSNGYDVVVIVNNALPSVSLLAVASIMLLILIGIFGAEKRWIGTPLSGWIAILAFIFIVVIFGSSAGIWDVTWLRYLDNDTIATIIVILVFALIVYYITKDDSSHEAAEAHHTMERVGNFFGGKGGGNH